MEIMKKKRCSCRTSRTTMNESSSGGKWHPVGVMNVLFTNLEESHHSEVKIFEVCGRKIYRLAAVGMSGRRSCMIRDDEGCLRSR